MPPASSKRPASWPRHWQKNSNSWMPIRSNPLSLPRPMRGDMNEPLTQEQYQNTMALDADQRYDHFIQQVVAQGELWILKDEQGCMLLTADEDDCIPVWPHADYAKAWAAE